MNLPKDTSIGVNRSSAQASVVSIERMSRKAPISCTEVMTNWGSNDVQASLTVLTSFSSREVMSPECNSSSNIRRWKR